MGALKYIKILAICLDARKVFLQYIAHLKRTALPEASGLSIFLEPKLVFHVLSTWQKTRALA